jgi:hypothetical protein
MYTDLIAIDYYLFCFIFFFLLYYDFVYNFVSSGYSDFAIYIKLCIYVSGSEEDGKGGNKNKKLLR